MRIADRSDGVVVPADDAAWREAFAVDIGVGGAFIADAGLHVGLAIFVELTLPTALHPLILPAVVRWVGAHLGQHGAGVQFVNVDVDVLLSLNEYFEQL